MEAMGQLTGGIAHDFNNLLMIVSGYAQILQKRLADPKIMEAIEAVQTAAKRGESLTRQLLTFSRRQRLSPVVVNLRERIEGMRPMLGSSLRGNIELVAEIADDIWPVEVDLAELELAVLNIAVNARDAMPEGGRFQISARNVALGAGSGMSRLQGEFVAISLKDSGAGMPPETLRKIFDPFFTTKPVGKGTGLGLSQVHGFAHQAGGTVTATSEPGKGTTLTIYLPRSHAEVAASGEASDARVAPPRREGIVLVVEDNPDVASVTSSLLDQLGYGIIHAENAADALEVLGRGAAIDLVFSDIVMPGGMDGIGLAQQIKAKHPQIPVLLTSGYSDAAQAAETEFLILRKPFEISALQRVIRNALANAAGTERGKAAPGSR
jgi:CheY-like chemotaxis protein